MNPENIGSRDRDVRMALGLLCGFLGVFVLVGWVQIPFVIVSIVLIATSMTGVCPLYRVFGITTNHATADKSKHRA